MIDGRFSADAFARLGPNTPEAEQLSHALGGEIAAEMRGAVEAAIRRVVEQLRELGHDLREWERKSCPQLHTCEYSFGPGDPPPPEGWLVVHFETWALVIFGPVNAEPAAAAGGERGGPPPADEAVPF